MTNMTTITSTAGNLVYTTSSGFDWVEGKNEEIISFIEFGLKLMGIDLEYSKFKEMSDSEKMSFIRDFKIERLLEKGDVKC